MRGLCAATSPCAYRGERTRAAKSEDTWDIEVLCKEGQLDRALHALVRMDQESNAPSEVVYKSLLQACMKRKSIDEARTVLAHMEKYGLQLDKALGDLVVTTLLTCGSLAAGVELFRKLSYRSVFSWTAIISGYINAGRYRDALSCYKQMQGEGIKPDKYTFVSLLKACSRLEDLEEGRRIHVAAVKHGFEQDIFVANTLVSMYAKCGSIRDAKQVFDRLSQRDVVSWNAMLAAYAQQGQGTEALKIYFQMQLKGVRPNDRTFVSALQACGIVAEAEESTMVQDQCIKPESLKQGRKLHAEIVERGFDSDVYVGNSLVSMYAKCGSIPDAQQVFDSLSRRDVVSWTALLAAYAQDGQGENSLQIYARMQEEGMRPNDRTFVSVLQACSTLAAEEEEFLVDGHNFKLESLQMGKKLHAEATKMGFQVDVFVSNSLITMYARCGSIPDSQLVFDRLSNRDNVSWNVMLATYAEQDQGHKALELYGQMQEEGVVPNGRTFVSALQACGSLAERDAGILVQGQSVKVESLHRGKQMHAQAAAKGLESDVFVQNTLIFFYLRCERLNDAEYVFEQLSQRDLLSWNAMISAYVQQGQGEKALQLYAQMQEEGVKPDESTYLAALEACSNTGAFDTCVCIHQGIIVSKISSSLRTATSLIHAYGRCGSMVSAQLVFDSIPVADVVSWTALLAGYARQGDYERSFRCYEDMRLAGLEPDQVTFMALLSACSHVGMVDKGLEYFGLMTGNCGISANLEHYVCVIDLVARAGLISKADDLISKMPVQPDLCVWLCLLSACRKHGDVVVAKRAFDKAVGLEPNEAAAYMLMSSIYANAGLWEDAMEVQELRHRSGASWKNAGQSWIEHEQQLHTFLVGDHRHDQKAQLYGLLKQLSSELQETGYDPPAALVSGTELG